MLGQIKKSEKYTNLHGNLVTTRNYDVLGRMTSLVDPAGNTWSYTFDSLNRNLTRVDPDAGTWTYGYDDAGRVVSQADAKAQTTTLEYDAAGRAQFKRIRPSGGTTGTVSEYVETTYGASASLFNRGRVTQVVTKNSAGVEQTGKLLFEYDALGRVTKQTRSLDGTNYAVERNYDAAGYLRGIKYPDNDIIGAAQRTIKGIEVSEATLSLDVIRAAVIGGPGHYLGAKQTLDLMQTEYIYPAIGDRLSPKEWNEVGRPKIIDRAIVKVQDVLSTNYPSHIPADIDARIRSELPIRLPVERMRPPA